MFVPLESMVTFTESILYNDSFFDDSSQICMREALLDDYPLTSTINIPKTLSPITKPHLAIF